MMTKEIDVKLLGKSFSFSIPDNIDTKDFLEVIKFVERKMIRIKNEMEDIDSFKLGLLTSINVAEEYFSLKKENEKLKVILNKIDKKLSPFDKENQIAISFSS